jgi:tetratricopeptide (TPR) repeat protein
MANTYDRLGHLLRDTGQLQEAEAAYRLAVEFYEKIVAASPTAADYREVLADTHRRLATLAGTDPLRFEEAEKHHRQEVAHREKLAVDFPTKPAYRQQIADSHRLWGLQLWDFGRLPEAEQALREGIEHYESYLRLAPKSAEAHNTLAWMLATVPAAKLRGPARAVELAQKAVELEPLQESWRTLGVAQYRAGDWKAALEALKKSMDLREGGDGVDWFFLAMAHWQLGQKEAARQCWTNRQVAGQISCQRGLRASRRSANLWGRKRNRRGVKWQRFCWSLTSCCSC